MSYGEETTLVVGVRLEDLVNAGLFEIRERDETVQRFHQITGEPYQTHLRTVRHFWHGEEVARREDGDTNWYGIGLGMPLWYLYGQSGTQGPWLHELPGLILGVEVLHLNQSDSRVESCPIGDITVAFRKVQEILHKIGWYGQISLFRIEPSKE